MVTANHGERGGSVVWTPKSGHGKEVFRVRGARKGLAVSIALPVRGLVEAQKNQLKRSIDHEADKWRNIVSSSSDGNKGKSKERFKTPPPDYLKKE